MWGSDTTVTISALVDTLRVSQFGILIQPMSLVRPWTRSRPPREVPAFDPLPPLSPPPPRRPATRWTDPNRGGEGAATATVVRVEMRIGRASNRCDRTRGFCPSLSATAFVLPPEGAIRLAELYRQTLGAQIKAPPKCGCWSNTLGRDKRSLPHPPRVSHVNP